MSLHEALLEIQANLPHVGKAAEADTGKFKYTYATLSDVNDALLPLLGKHGLTWTCGPETTEAGWALRGRLSDGDETLDVWWPMPHTDDPQRLGSAVTYGRRYLLCALVGLVPDDDDDGAAARKPAETPAYVAAMLAVRDLLRDIHRACGQDTGHPTFRQARSLVKKAGIDDPTKDAGFEQAGVETLAGLVSELEALEVDDG